ncbi:E3 ubiquitin-protein ligase HUWE1-like [Branchiostoma lanceolatum]|uniref:E3 ubiquitin-protein ligase HUWE1-like n=1 Tax=Branchiostoma lanceolatum TaxID=7740 RepID=UPI003457050E
MKIDRTKLKKTVSEVPADCKALIEHLKTVPLEELPGVLDSIKTWNYGKCELVHWIDVLDRFDTILEEACLTPPGAEWTLPIDRPDMVQSKERLLKVLQFTALLIEHSFSRHLYNSMEHVTRLLSSSDMGLVLPVLNLLYVFSKRSNFITRLAAEKRQTLLGRLQHLAESWGGKENGFGLAECCQDLPFTSYPASATTLHFEFYTEVSDEKSTPGKKPVNAVQCIHIENVDKVAQSPAEIMENLLKVYNVPKDKQMLLFTHIRLAYCFSDYRLRLQCVQARLQALSVLVYSAALQDNANTLLYNGLIEELVDVLQLKDTRLTEIKAASLRTLTAIIHLERNPKLGNIIDATGAASYHGFLPVLVRSCIHAMTDPAESPFPQPFATALFSFLYHLASYEAGGEALVSCGMMESLLKVINWLGDDQDNIIFVTRAVRVVDLITNLDMTSFQTHSGLTCFINRLEHEVEICRKECPFVITPIISAEDGEEEEEHPEEENREGQVATETRNQSEEGAVAMETETAASTSSGSSDVPMEMDGPSPASTSSMSEDTRTETGAKKPGTGLDDPQKQCFPQRAALMKSMLNFLKKAIPDPAFSDSIRHVMDGSLPVSLKHIISNAEYYGPSLFLLATDVVTVYVFQEPSLLSSLQDNGLTDVVLHALLIKDVPATREVLSALPNVFSALCLNQRGLQAFVRCRPFDKLFKVLLSEAYLPAMRRRRSSDTLGDTASNLGNAMDELMRHQPTLRTDATKAIIKLLEQVCAMGQDAKFICTKPDTKATPNNQSPRQPVLEETYSEDEEEEDDVSSTTSQTSASKGQAPELQETKAPGTEEARTPIPLLDYVLNVMKFVESILSNNTTDDHCREFVTQKGLVPLLDILGLPNLPIDFPTSPACQAVAGVCKSILTLAHEPQVLKQGLLKLNEVLEALEPLYQPLDPPGGSVLLRELANSAANPDAVLSSRDTPLLHAMAAAHSYILMFVHVCRVGQTDIRSMSVSHWGSDLGQNVLKGLSRLYQSLVWESTVLLSLCTPGALPEDCEFGKADMTKLLPKDDPKSSRSKLDAGKLDADKPGSSAESERTEDAATEMEVSPMEVEDVGLNDADKKLKISPQLAAQIKQIKPLLSASSRLGRALAELFGLLVKLCVGSPVRQRSRQHPQGSTTAPTPAARATAASLTRLLASGLCWEPPPSCPTPKFRLTFFICSVGFTSPMLFDEKKFPYHLMLQKFLSSGGLDALFETFHWTLTHGGKVSLQEGLEHPELPDGSGEFLDAWLMLVEKMVNVKNVLESPHTLPAKPSATAPGFVPFSSVQFLVHVHKAAFKAVMHLWDKKPLKTYGARMSESMLAMFCHVLKGEKTIQERLEKERQGEEAEKEAAQAAAVAAGTEGAAAAPAAAAVTAAAAAPARPREPDFNQAHLQQLMDMGFTREHAVEALTHTTSLEQATEYCLTHPPPIPLAAQELADEIGMSEEDQLSRAIAMSLGANVNPEVSDIRLLKANVNPEEEAKKKEEEDKKKREQEEAERDKQKDEEPLDPQLLADFTENLLPGCLRLVDALPDTVYRVCDLLLVAVKRNNAAWRDKMLVDVAGQICSCAVVLLEAAAPLRAGDDRTVQDWSNQLSNLPQAAQLSARAHLFTLLFEELRQPCAQVLEDSGLVTSLVSLLETAQQCLSACKDAPTPKWLAPVVLLVDLYQKMAVSSKRRNAITKELESHTWKWFDDRTGRWCNYSASNNATIDQAYRAGEATVRFTAGRRRYIVHFGTMVQINEETANRRPIMLSLPPKDDKDKDNSREEKRTKEKRASAKAFLQKVVGTGAAAAGAGAEQAETQAADEENTEEKKVEAEQKMETDESAAPKEEEEKKKEPEKKVPEEPARLIKGLASEQISTLVRACVGLVGIPVDPDTLHAVMRLCLRCTREHQHALQFADLGGTKLLLDLKQSSAFTGFNGLATLLIRHVLEEPNTLRHTMEKVCWSVCWFVCFTGFSGLATLLIRHVLEEPNTLRHTMEKVCWSVCWFVCFTGFSGLATLLIRHVLEEPNTLRHTMEKVCWFVCWFVCFTGFNGLATLLIRHVLEEPNTLRHTMEKVCWFVCWFVCFTGFNGLATLLIRHVLEEPNTLRHTMEKRFSDAADPARPGGTQHSQAHHGEGLLFVCFTGFSGLATLLIRHVLEEPNTLRHTMEKVCWFVVCLFYWVQRFSDATDPARPGGTQHSQAHHGEGLLFVCFTGFSGLATLLIRHVLEEPNTLRHTMEKVCWFVVCLFYWVQRFSDATDPARPGGTQHSQAHHGEGLLFVCFTGFSGLATLLIRHVLEEPNTLRHTMEKAVRGTAAGGTGSNVLGVAAGSLGSREFHYLLRILGPAACRSAEMFRETAWNALRIALPPPSRRGNLVVLAASDEEEYNRVLGPNAVQLLKTASSKPFAPPPLEGVIKEVMYDLLNALATQPTETSTEGAANTAESDTETGEAVMNFGNETGAQAIRRQNSVTELDGGSEYDSGTYQLSGSDIFVSAPSSRAASTENLDQQGTEPDDKASKDKAAAELKAKAAANRPLMTKSAILKLLAELVRSYASVALQISQYHYTAGQVDGIKEDGTVLAYVLDNLLPTGTDDTDKDTPMLARTLLAAIAASNHSPDAQGLLVQEVKAALSRALALPESSDKHTRVQALVGLIGTMMEACPPTGGFQQHQVGHYVHVTLDIRELCDKHTRVQALVGLIGTMMEACPPTGGFQQHQQAFKSQQQNSMNNMIRIFLRRGLVTDLARIPHSLDLSSPNMATTVNAALKPLETLSRIVNQPSTMVGKSGAKAKEGAPSATGEETGNSQQDTDTETPRTEDGEQGTQEDTQATRGEGEDNEGFAESLEAPVSQESHTNPMQYGGDLDDVIDQLLEGDTEDDILAETLMVSSTRRIQRESTTDSQGLGDSQLTQDSQDGEDTEMASEHSQEGVRRNDMVVVESGEEDHNDDDDDEGGSSADDSGSEEEDEHDEQEEEEEEEEDGDEEDVEDEGSEMGRTFDIDEYEDDSLFRLQEGDEDLFLQLEEMFSNAGEAYQWGLPSSVRTCTYPLPVAVHDDNGNDGSGNPSALAAPSMSIAVSHPLMVRHADHSQVAGIVTSSGRVHRLGRTGRGHRHYVPATQTIHVHYSGGTRPQPPAILQRLLGPTAAADVLQLTQQTGRQYARVFIGGDDVRVMAGQDDDIFDDDICGGGGFSDAAPSTGAGLLQNVLTAQNRWAEECRVLDGDGVHHVIAAVKKSILEKLEEHCKKELEERQEKKKKQQEEDDKKKKEKEEEDKKKKEKEAKEKGETVGAEGREGEAMEVGTSESTETSASASTLPGSQSQASIVAEIISAVGGLDSNGLEPAGETAERAPEGSTPSRGEAGSAEAGSTEPAASVPTAVTASPASAPPAPVVARSYNVSVTPSLPFPSDLQQLVAEETARQATEQGSSSRQPAEETTPQVAGFLPAPMETSSSTTSGQDDVTTSTDSSVSISPGAGTDGAGTDAAMPMDTSEAAVGQAAQRQGSADSGTSAGTTATAEGGEGEQAAAQTTDGESSGTTSGADSQPSTSTGTTEGSASSAETPTSEGQGAASTAETAQATPGNEELNSLLGSDVQLPEGVDPSFLAALPEDIRQEVLRTQLGIRRTPPTTQAGNSSGTSSTSTTAPDSVQVSPEFLAALPPEIQEEVLQYERMEQQRLEAQRAAANPEQPVDPAGFIQNLPSSLRQQVLADMDDTVLAVMPPEIAAEARNLRRELEERHRQLMQERLFSAASGLASRLGGRGIHYIQSALPQHHRNTWRWGTQHNRAATATTANQVRLRGRQLLDHEALACLLVLLFVDEPKLNTSRLHRVLRNLCYHSGTRMWVVHALLSILDRTGDNLCKVRNPNPTSATTAAPACGWCTPCCPYWTARATTSARYVTLTQPLLPQRHPHVGGARPAVHTGPHGRQPLQGTGTRMWVVHALLSILDRTGDNLCKPNLCYHNGTRMWVVHALLSILDRTGDNLCKPLEITDGSEKGSGKKSRPSSSTSQDMAMDTRTSQPSWLSISLDAALGCRANVFQIQKVGGKKHVERHSGAVHIHPQASPIVCRHVMDTLISLAKVFPGHFIPGKAREAGTCSTSSSQTQANKVKETPPPTTASVVTTNRVGSSKTDTDFWDVLVKLDCMSVGRKGKGTAKSHGAGASGSESEQSAESLETSPLGLLLQMLAHPVIRRSSVLTDKLLRLLSLVSIALPEEMKKAEEQAREEAARREENRTDEAATESGAAGGTEAAAAEQRPAEQTAPVQSTLELVPTATSTPSPTLSRKDTVPLRPTSTSSVFDDSAGRATSIMLEKQLQLAVDILTSHSCSEEGLEDATNVLLQLSRIDNQTRESVLKLLLQGGRQLGHTLCEQIFQLLQEVRDHITRLKQQGASGAEGGMEELASPEEGAAGTSQARQRGVLSNRFDSQMVVVAAPTKVKGGRELQLPSMAQLTAKTSTQSFFLRILKVIIQLREAARRAVKKARDAEKRQGGLNISTTASSVASAVAALEAEAEAIIEMVGRRERERLQRENSAPAAPGTAAAGASTSNEDQAAPPEASSEDPAGAALGDIIGEAPMDVEQQAAGSAGSAAPVAEETPAQDEEQQAGKKEKEEPDEPELPRLSSQLTLEELWDTLSECLTALSDTTDHHAVLVLQPAVEAFFLVHAAEKEKKAAEQRQSERQRHDSHLSDHAPMSPLPATPADSGTSLGRQESVASVSSVANITGLPHDTQKFLRFAKTHRTVLNQILRQSTQHLADGPFSVLVDHTHILDFDVKRRFFRQELERMDEGIRREDLAVHVRRDHVFEDSFRELHRRTPEELKNRLYIVFEGEEGQDAGGLLREWYLIISREIFNPNYALFTISPGDRVTYRPNPSSHCNPNHLSYFKFVGRVIGKAIYDNKLLECYFTRSFYKHILGKNVKYTDMESEDYQFYQGLTFLLENNIEESGLELTFSTEIQEFGVTEVRDLKQNGRNIVVTEENKHEYVKLVCQLKMTGSIRKQIDAFLEGFYEIIPKRLISIFNEQELELLISGLPNIDLDDLKANSEYHKYQSNSLQIQWFWRALRSYDQADRAKFLQFVTGTSKVPLQGFSHLEGMNGTQKFQIHRDDRSTDRLPSAHTCFNQLDLPPYETYEKLHYMLKIAIQECSEGFGFA